MILRLAASIVTLLAVTLTASACQSEISESAAESPVVEKEQHSGSPTGMLGDGFVVWESNRSGNWRLWRRDLETDPGLPERR